MSLDGVITGPDDREGQALGRHGGRLFNWLDDRTSTGPSGQVFRELMATGPDRGTAHLRTRRSLARRPPRPRTGHVLTYHADDDGMPPGNTRFFTDVVACATEARAPTSAGAGPGRQAQREYIVLYSDGASLAAARAGVTAAGGTLVREDQAVGVAAVRSSRSDFASVAARSAAIAGVAGNRSIGSAPSGSGARQKPNQVEKLGRVRGASAAGKPTRAVVEIDAGTTPGSH
jgi:hypothetical protein